MLSDKLLHGADMNMVIAVKIECPKVLRPLLVLPRMVTAFFHSDPVWCPLSRLRPDHPQHPACLRMP